jgi:hypothetical protein
MIEVLDALKLLPKPEDFNMAMIKEKPVFEDMTCDQAIN